MSSRVTGVVMAFTPEQKATCDHFERSGYLPALREWIVGHTAPFFWHDVSGRICGSGTLSFVDTGEERLAITADHVYRAYLQDLEAGAVLECQFGGVLVRPERMLIARHPQLDVATFRMPTVALTKGASFHSARGWPPQQPKPGEWLFYAGYPGAHRVENDSTIDAGLQTLLGPVSDVSGSTIVFCLDFESLHWPLHDGAEINRRLGGMSGGPVFRLVEQGLTRLELVGFVYEHGEGLELVFARAAGVVASNGTIASF
jgi:hypothetical protein